MSKQKLSEKLRLRLANLLIQHSKFNTDTDKGALIHSGELAEGVEVFVASESEDPAPAPDGEYIAGDQIIVVADGKVASISTSEAMEDEAPATDGEAIIEEVKDLLEEVVGVVETIEGEIETLENEVAEFKAFKKEFSAFKAKFNATPKANPTDTRKPVDEGAAMSFRDLKEALKAPKIKH